MVKGRLLTSRFTETKRAPHDSPTWLVWPMLWSFRCPQSTPYVVFPRMFRPQSVCALCIRFDHALRLWSVRAIRLRSVRASVRPIRLRSVCASVRAIRLRSVCALRIRSVRAIRLRFDHVLRLWSVCVIRLQFDHALRLWSVRAIRLWSVSAIRLRSVRAVLVYLCCFRVECLKFFLDLCCFRAQ